jgi:hypothetical protein
MHGPINVKSPNNTTKWQMGFNSAFKGLRKTGRTLVWDSHRPLHRVANVKSSVANDETGFKVLTLKDLLESSKVSRQPIGKRETKF